MEEDNREIFNKNIDLKMWKKAIKYLAKYMNHVIGIVIAMIINAATDAALPLFTEYAIDNFIAYKTTEGLGLFIILYVLLLILKGMTIYTFIYLADKLWHLVSHDIRVDGFKKLQELSFSYYDRNATGSLFTRVTSDVGRLTGIISWGLVDMIWAISMIAMMTVYMFMKNVKITLVVLTVIPILAVISVFFQKRILFYSREARRYNSIITGAFSEGIQGATTSKTLVREESHISDFEKKTDDMRTASIKTAVYSGLFFPIVSVLGIIGTSLAIWQGGVMILGEVITVGTLTLFISYTLQFFLPVNDMARIFARFQFSQAAGERIMALLEADIDIKDSDEVIEKYGNITSDMPVPKLKGSIRFENVSFRYKEGEKVLDTFNLNVEPGQCIALVGETGSGKTTIVNLACRFYEPTEGTIYIDGQDYKTIPLMYIHKNLGYMLQTPHLFSGTIMDNIRYGREDATEEEVINAAKMVEAHDFIMKFENGYNHVISKGGGGISTGQKQLICIARAIVNDPCIFVLDEATSSVDTQTEKAVQRAISKVLYNRTSFVVAHRLSTIREADRILVIDKGKVIEQGSHEELMKLKGHYHNLYTSQFIDDSNKDLFGTPEPLPVED
ncbi:MAG TPA: ABC transporter ATP-binding protein [Clostridia bacterium]|jgi:ATP-binding cassette subfamily B protein|nr:ABC transporter ATP-binding protein [Clostridia bacterium]HQC68198.1 ABC transporter ATP-binding protein [Clostridia bacterium]